MVAKGEFGVKDDIVNVHDNVFEIEEDLHHFALENITGNHESLRKAVVGILAPWKDDSAELATFGVEDEVVVALVEIQTGGVSEATHFPNNVIDVGQRKRLALKSGVEAAQIG